MNIVGFIEPDEAGDAYVTSDEAAEMCGVKAATIRQWVHRGHLPRYAFAEGWPYRLIYKREDVIACNERRTRGLNARSTSEPGDYVARLVDLTPEAAIDALEAHLEESLRSWNPPHMDPRS